jgi:hypothetical protein
MFTEGSCHQEEIIVTSMKGRLEAYLPENKVFLHQGPMPDGLWKDKSTPLPSESFTEEIFNSYDLQQVYDFANSIPEMPLGYHYCLTVMKEVFDHAIKDSRERWPFTPKVTLDDGIKAVEMGITSMVNISNGDKVTPVMAHDGTLSKIFINHVPNTNRGHDKTIMFVNGGNSYNGSNEDYMQ